MIERHVELTESEWGARVLERWEMMLGYWVYVVPKNLAASDAISQQDVPLRVVRA
jgi:glutamate synthase domain-containing protein 3